MNGEELNKYLDRGFLGKTKIKALAFTSIGMVLQRPSDLQAQIGITNSVTQQYNQVNAVWNTKSNELIISANPNGNGYWIPYLGNGIPHIGIANRGLGTFTPRIPENISWVATGPFSGCHAYVFPGPRFAHVITPAHNYTADTIDNQLGNIAGISHGSYLNGGRIPLRKGVGWVFWTKINGVWYQRQVYTSSNGVSESVINVSKKEQVY